MLTKPLLEDEEGISQSNSLPNSHYITDNYLTQRYFYGVIVKHHYHSIFYCCIMFLKGENRHYLIYSNYSKFSHP